MALSSSFLNLVLGSMFFRMPKYSQSYSPQNCCVLLTVRHPVAKYNLFDKDASSTQKDSGIFPIIFILSQMLPVYARRHFVVGSFNSVLSILQL